MEISSRDSSCRERLFAHRKRTRTTKYNKVVVHAAVKTQRVLGAIWWYPQTFVIER